MQAKPEIKKGLIIGLLENKNWVSGCYDRCIENLRNADTVEEIMEIKRDFIKELLNELPIDGHCCYFCIENRDQCSSCMYGKVHKICNSDGSDYDKITRSIHQVIDVLDLYYKGEAYDEQEG